MPMADNVHDKLFRTTFRQVEHAAGELRRMLPAGLVERVDWSTLRHCPGSFVDEALKERHTDLLFSVKLSGFSAFLYVVCEHQSSVEELMAFRLLCYLVRIWEEYLGNNPQAKRLPVIVPVVVHHSEQGWTATTAFEELLDLDAEGLSMVAEHVPHFRFLLDDVSFESDEELRGRAMMSALGRVVLWCLRNGRSPWRIEQEIGGWVELLGEVKRGANGAGALRRIWRYIFAVSERTEAEELLEKLLAAVGEEGKEELVTVAEQLREQGRKEGRKEGHEKGWNKRLQQQRNLVLKLLSRRFGELSEAAVAAVNAADYEQLDEWVERLLTAPTLAEVLADTAATE